MSKPHEDRHRTAHYHRHDDPYFLPPGLVEDDLVIFDAVGWRVFLAALAALACLAFSTKIEHFEAAASSAAWIAAAIDVTRRETQEQVNAAMR